MKMTYETELDFSSFDKPKTKDPIAVAEHLNELLSTYLSYDEYIYRPELALSKEKGNCYAWAQLGALALESWDMPTAIVLDRSHAHIATQIDKNILFIDLVPGRVRDIAREANCRNGLHSSLGLLSLYREYLPQAFEDTEFTLFFRQEIEADSSPWCVDKRNVIASDRREKNYRVDSAHLIFDSTKAADVLNAIGDLQRYSELKSEKYYYRYDELQQYIPDFVTI